MRGFMGCDADLKPGTVIVTGNHLEVKLVILRAATEEEARESAKELGLPELKVVPGERFYEVESTVLPVSPPN